MRTEFEVLDDDTYYFLYVTDEVRIESTANGLVMELRGTYTTIPLDIELYLSCSDNRDNYFNLSTINPHIDICILAVQILQSHLLREYQ